MKTTIGGKIEKNDGSEKEKNKIGEKERKGGSRPVYTFLIISLVEAKEDTNRSRLVYCPC